VWLKSVSPKVRRTPLFAWMYVCWLLFPWSTFIPPCLPSSGVLTSYEEVWLTSDPGTDPGTGQASHVLFHLPSSGVRTSYEEVWPTSDPGTEYLAVFLCFTLSFSSSDVTSYEEVQLTSVEVGFSSCMDTSVPVADLSPRGQSS